MTDAEWLSKLQGDPCLHIEQIQGVSTLQPYQSVIAQAIASNRLTAIRAAHGVGKSWLLAHIVLWFGSSFPRSKIITTAPTFTQVESLLWSEIRAGYSASRFPLGGRMLNTDWKLDDDWFAIGLSPKDDADSESGQGKTSGFQGFHAPHLLIVFDEATGVSEKRWIQAQGMLTSANVKMVVIGNPTSKSTAFYRCFKSPQWKKIKISCFDSPNVQANGIHNLEDLKAELGRLKEMGEEAALTAIEAYKVVHPALLTLQAVVDSAIKWGVDHPLFISKFLGEFPEEDENSLFTLGMIEIAQARMYYPKITDRFSIGIDVARFGGDRSVLTPIWGSQVYDPQALMKRDNTEVAGAAIKMLREYLERGVDPELATLIIDGTGVGSGVVDILKEQKRFGRIHHKVEIREIHFGQGFADERLDKEREYDAKHYANMKAKMIVRLSQDMKTTLALPSNGAYSEELPTILYFLDSKGRYVIESKDDYKERTGLQSPDYGDSLALANEGRYTQKQEVGQMRVIKR